MVTIANYIEETLGLKATITPWVHSSDLPLYLLDGKSYYSLKLDQQSFLLIQIDVSRFNLAAYRKHASALSEHTQDPIALCFDRLTSYQRKALIQQRMAFVVPKSIIYLPQLGLAFQNRSIPAPPVMKRLSPMAQAVLLKLIYDSRDTKINQSDLARQLKTSKMSISRAVRELQAIQVTEIRKIGREAIISPTYETRELYRKAQPYLINPVQKRCFVKCERWLEALPDAGETALSKKTMLGEPKYPCKAVYNKSKLLLEPIDEIDPDWNTQLDIIELEVWKYDPSQFASDNTVDRISLAQSLSENKDERVEDAVKMLLEELGRTEGRMA